jgi:hypothetical protein
LAKRCHPDIGNQDTEPLMANINAARAIIVMSYRKARGGARSTAMPRVRREGHAIVYVHWADAPASDRRHP